MAIVSTRSTILGSGTKVELPFVTGTVDEFYNGIGWPENVRGLAVAVLNGRLLGKEEWESTEVAYADNIMFALLPAGGGEGGGKTALATIASIALLVAAPWAGGMLAGTITGLSKTVATAIISVAGSLIIGAVFKPPLATLRGGRGDDTPFFSITSAANQTNHYGVVPRLYGRMKMYPVIAAEPISITANGQNTFTGLYDLGYGPLELDNVGRSQPRMGETLVRDMQETGEIKALYLHEYIGIGAQGGARLRVYKNDFKSLGVGSILQKTAWPIPVPDIAPTNAVERTTEPDTQGVILDIYFPAGLSRRTSSGKAVDAEVGIGIARKNITDDLAWENVNPTSSELQLGSSSGVTGRVIETTRVESRDVTLYLPVLYEYDGSTPPEEGTTITSDKTFGSPWTMQFGASSGADFLYDNLSGIGYLQPVSTNSHAKLEITGQGGSTLVQYKIRIRAGHSGVGNAKISIRYATGIVIKNVMFNPPEGNPPVHDFSSHEFNFMAVENEDLVIYVWPDQQLGTSRLLVDSLRISRGAAEGREGSCGAALPGVPFSCGGYAQSETTVFVFVDHASANPITAGDRLKFEDDANEYHVISAVGTQSDDPLEPSNYLYEVELDAPLGPLYVKGFTGTVKTFNGIRYTTLATRHRTIIEPGIYIKANKVVPFGISIWLGKNTAGALWPQKTWGVRLGRISENNPDFAQDEMVWQLMRSVAQRSPINLDAPHSMIELQLDATHKTQGRVDTLSVIPHSILPHYNAAGVPVSSRRTSNPAWIYLNILLGASTQTRPARSMIDWPSISEWAQYCDSNGLMFNAVIDWAGPLLDLLELVCSVGRATFNLNDGKYSVIFDGYTTANPTPVQLITPSNTSNFEASIKYLAIPHALKLPFKNEAEDFADDVVVVYSDGYSAVNATDIEEIILIGITNADQIYKAGRYYLAQAVLQREAISVTMDIENIVMQRGDIVAVANDAFSVGGQSCRIIEVDPGGAYILLDQDVGGGVDTAFKLRTSAGSITAAVAAQRHATIANRIETPMSFPEKADMQVGDLIVWGFIATTTGLFRVSGIYPAQDLTATIELIEHNPQLYEWDGGPIPPHEPAGGGTPAATIGPVEALVSTLTHTPNEDTHIWETEVILSWAPPNFGTATLHRIYTLSGDSFLPIGETSSRTFRIDYGERPAVLDTVTYGVVAISSRGVESDLTRATVTIPPDSIPPADVDAFSGDILPNAIQLDWQYTDVDGDLAGFRIMYSEDPIPGHSDYSNISVPAVPGGGLVDWAERSIKLDGKRRGAFYIKAVDTTGLESQNAIAIYSDVPADFGVQRCVHTHNIWQDTIPGSDISITPTTPRYGYSSTNEISAGPVFLGYASDITLVAHTLGPDHPVPGGLDLQLHYDSATDTFFNAGLFEGPNTSPGFVKNTSCYLTPQIVLEKRVLAGAGVIDIAEVTVRAVYKTWRTGETEPGAWELITPAKTYVLDNILFAFELRTHNNKATPVVARAGICQSFDERTLKDYGINVPVAGLLITFPAPFMQPPTISILAESMLPGDSWKITQKTVDGFFVQFFSSTAAQKSATIDWIATGYGVQ